MKINPNYKFNIILGLSHFLADAISAFILTSISLNILSNNNFVFDKFVGIEITKYFIIYNFLSFFLQVFVGYFSDKVKNNHKSFEISKKFILISFLFYAIGIIFIDLNYYLAVGIVGIGSCLFHLGSGNISLLSPKNKATNLGFFASGGVVGLSFGSFIALVFPNLIIGVIILLAIIGVYIYSKSNYEIEEKMTLKYKNISEKLKNYLFIIIVFLLLSLVIRSAIWTNFQIEFVNNRIVIFYLAIAAFFGKITGGLLEDSKYFNKAFFFMIGFLSFLFVFLYSFFFNNILILLAGIFLIQIFVSPATVIIYEVVSKNRGIIIGFSFGLSLVLGYLIVMIF